MKNFKFHFILIFLFGNLFQFNQLPAQVGFSKVYDFSAINYHSHSSKTIASCADGGYAINYQKPLSGSTYLLKTDSNGVVLWTKTIQMLPLAIDDVDAYDLIATPDSGFLYSVLIHNGMMSAFVKTVIFKLDKNGNVQHSTETDFGTFATKTQKIPFHFYNKFTQTMSSLVYEYDYDGFGNICCQAQAFVRLDSALNIIQQFRISSPFGEILGNSSSSVTEIHTNNGHVGNFLTLTDVMPNNSQIILIDTSGNVLWQKHFLDIRAKVSLQFKNAIYFISEYGSNSFLHKLDLQGNIIFSKIFSNSFKISSEKMAISADSTIYVSGVKKIQNQQKYNTVIMELDTLGNVLQAFESIDSTQIQSSFINAKTGAFLFTKYSLFNSYSFTFEKVYLNSNSCNIVPIIISTYDTTISDISGVTTIDSLNISLFPPTFTTDSNSVVITFINCGPLAINDHSSSNIDLQIYPNPVSDILHIELDNTYNKPLQIQVTDILGRTVHENQFFDSDFELRVSGMKKGVYFLTVSGKDILENRKFVVQ